MSQPPVPVVVVIGGPNGAGKTTISRAVLSETLRLREFVNADVIAQGLSGFDPQRAAMGAGRVMLARLKELAAARESFGFESTLASRSFAPWVRELVRNGYEFHILYVSLRSARLAIRRVRRRVRAGGHSVPDEVVSRRFVRSARNLFDLYMPLATSWRIFDNSDADLRLVAESGGSGVVTHDLRSYLRLRTAAHGDDQEQADE